ncbi:hypothetical protein Q6348_08650 [Isoptericola sp. b441]|uniref:ABC transport system permease protein n=1 Tax=Actinotalea lenta TaxID=3064654 RepID=A0ABT9DDB0_9CELL|nr:MULTISPECIES: hypothetical protein [unclassified Isoptericola]MDO8107263.1 hypothetical protein [Isoptericola sp. b441]MDO8121074.1 hypothetical protein [Isoptericola sp. b490]
MTVAGRRRALARRRRGALAVLAVAVALAVTIPPAVAMTTAQRTDALARRAAATLDAAERGVRVTTSSADDAAAQLVGGDAVLHRLLGDVPVLTARLTYPLDARTAPEADPDRSVVLAHLPDWAQQVVVTGRAPRPGDPLEVLAPQVSGLAAGTELLVGSAEVPVRVVGTWRPVDPHDAVWFADPGLGRGTMTGLKDAVGPLLTADEAAVDRAARRPLVRWTVVPSLQGLSVAQLAHLATALDTVPGALDDAGLLVQGATIDARGGANLAEITDAATSSRRTARSAVGAGAAAGVAGVWAAAAALAAATRRERTLLLARGARPVALLDREAPGVLAAATLGGVVGWPSTVAAGWPAWWAAAAALGGAAATLGPVARRLPVDRGRMRPGAAATTAVLAVATGLTTWDATRSGEGIGVAAPALLLICAGLVGGLAAPMLAGAAAPVARRGRGLVPVLTARSVARSFGPLPLLAALVGGAVTYAASTPRTGVATGWATAALGATLVAVLASGCHAAAERESRRAEDVDLDRLTVRRPVRAARRVAQGAALVVAAGTGTLTALVTVGLVAP